MVGQTEEAADRRGDALRAGIARWSELARGVITGDRDGLLKLLVSPEDRRMLGVHVLGHGRHRARAHRPGGDGVRLGGAGLPRHGGVQLPDVRRVLQGGRAGRRRTGSGRWRASATRPAASAGRRGPAGDGGAARVGRALGLPRPPRGPRGRPPRRRRRRGRRSPPCCARRSRPGVRRRRRRREARGHAAERLRELRRDHEDLVRARPGRAAGASAGTGRRAAPGRARRRGWRRRRSRSPSPRPRP